MKVILPPGAQEKWPVLDNGYIQLRDAWGSDEQIVEAARMSTGKGFLGWGPKHTESCPSTLKEDYVKWDGDAGSVVLPGACNCIPKPGDEKLLAYLWSHRHTTPFEQAGLTVEVQAPIFVFREWHRHRTQSYNEFSARYSQMPNLHYVPSLDRLYPKQDKNRQAQGVVATVASSVDLKIWLDRAAELQLDVYEHYERGLALGIPKEVARLNTPVARYSRMVASANLLNWLRFLGLRQAEDAQFEIREYAKQLGDIVAVLFPRTWALFREKAI